MSRVAGSLVCAVLLAGGLAACSSDGAHLEPVPAVSSPSTTRAAPPVPVASPTLTGSDVDVDVTATPKPPKALREKPSESRAVDVAEYYLALFPYAAATGDFAQWDALSDPGCRFCSANRDDMAEVLAAGHHGAGGAITVLAATGRENQAGYSYSVLATFEQARSASVDTSGDVVESFDGPKTYQSEIVLHWADGKWQVAAIDAEELA